MSMHVMFLAVIFCTIVAGLKPRDFEWLGHLWTTMEVIVMHTTFIDLFKSVFM